MKLNKEFIVHETGGETLLVPLGGAEFSGLARGNATFGAILELLRRDVTRDELVAALRAQYDAPDGAVERDVDRALETLREIGALEPFS